MVQTFSKNYIHFILKYGSGVDIWRGTGFYGEPNMSMRVVSWNLLLSFPILVNLFKDCFGSFNELVSIDEKFGGRNRFESLMEGFREAIVDCGFRNLLINGPFFTWSRGDRVEAVYERLDLCLAT